jgi:4-hydroxybenzoate polyprenyltransferase
MTLRDILLHFRLPFSFFLMPVYWFAISQSQNVETKKAIWIFIILHLFVYPASNAYNSYFDKDEGSIGGLEKPPAVDKNLFWAAWIVDVLAIIISFFAISPLFALMMFVYGLVSKAYAMTTSA